MRKGNFRKIEIDIATVKEREQEVEEIEKIKTEAILRLKLLGLTDDFLEELKSEFKIKVADGKTSRDMNSFEKELLKKVFSEYEEFMYLQDFYFPYYIIEYRNNATSKHYLDVLFIKRGDFNEFDRHLIKNANCTQVIHCDITDSENITINRYAMSIIKKYGNALHSTACICRLEGKILYCEENEEIIAEFLEKVSNLYEERRRNKVHSYTRVYRSALTGEIIKTEPIIPDWLNN